MNAWGLDQNLTISNAIQLGRLMNYSDVNFTQIVTIKKALQLAMEKDDGNKDIIETFLSACDGDMVTLENGLRNHKDIINSLYPVESKGCTLLIFAICFDHSELVESLINHGCDVDTPDTIINYTPIMWAVYFNQLDIVKILLNNQADPFLCPKDDGKNAVSILNHENVEMTEFFRSHNLLNKSFDQSDYFQDNSFQGEQEIDELSNKIKLQTIDVNAYEEEKDYNKELDEFYEEQELGRDHLLVQLKEFEYDKVLPDECIKFTDSDIPTLLDFIFNLRVNNVKHQHDTKIPAAIIFQLIRYSHFKVDSEDLTNFTFDCFIIRLRTVTNTKSGVFNMIIQDDPDSIGGAGDIVLLSYWLSVIQFLHFYFCKNDIYKIYPKFLQELINVIQSLISTLSFSINSRLNILVDDCILNFTNLVDVSNVLYAKDWNFFKSKKQHSNSFDDIYDMLYPPSQIELMKPSPLKYIQTLGALDYVLNLHSVDYLTRFQCFSQVFYYIDSIIFNKVIGNSKYCSRSKGIQIRLNISAIEDWLRSHNYKIFKPDTIGNLKSLVPENFTLQHLLDDGGKLNKRNPHNLIFYYNSIYFIGKTQLQPTIELLQFLQCMSSLNDEESFINTINQFDYLNYYQILKITKNYKYEINETKLPKLIINLVKKLISEQGENQIKLINLDYMIQNKLLSKEYNIYINPNFIYKVSLPNLPELINNYGSGLGGVRVLRAKKYQPSLPIDVLDDIDDLLSKNKNDLNDTYDYDQDKEEESDDEDEKHEAKDFKGDELFKPVQLPSSLAYKNWGDNDIEDNPW
ncbi:dilute domain-containing protein [[Candida] jaroonii]|uniref:Dilute domain-containing protein n=1 Tax=[Candida] jaroonii TaxID=467808 RepID=A0ACA9YCE7_9ASCO|nr:dilute domain-containing protein [[Candida] jaroonii]